jgi:hypothetical protein
VIQSGLREFGGADKGTCFIFAFLPSALGKSLAGIFEVRLSILSLYALSRQGQRSK